MTKSNIQNKATIWGIHMGVHVGALPTENGYIAIGWPELGELTEISKSRESLKEALSTSTQKSKKAAIAGNAGVLFRFCQVMQKGDIVIYPSKHDRMINIGRITGDYRYIRNDPHSYPNHRQVEWLESIPRNEFHQSALNEIGAFITLFQVKKNKSAFLSKINIKVNIETDEEESLEEIDDASETEAVAQQAQQTTDDYLIKQLYDHLNGYEFEHFVAHILECMGYKSRVSTKSGDGGVDVIAHKDELGFEPPIIKVQCKKSTSQNSEPEVSQLLGTLSEGEYALFVNLGSYSRPARLLERNKAKLRLIDGEELADLVLEHYNKLSPKYRTLLPLKQIYVPDLS